MPSRAERRRLLERAWRGVALAALALALAQALRGPSRATELVPDEALPAALPRLTRSARPADIEVSFRAAPAADTRDWLAALRRAGGRVRWRGEGAIAPLALELSARPAPAGGIRALAAGAAGDTLRLGDGASALATIALRGPAASVALPEFVPPLIGREGTQEARARPADSLAPRTVAVLGAAGWEGKFLLAALEERGWRTSARFAVAPGIAVTQGGALPLDTARDGVVIVLDSATATTEARRVVAFVKQGGGLILAGGAVRAPALAPIAPGRSGPRVRPAMLAFTDSAPRRALGFEPVTRLATDAIALETRDGRVAVAARRVGAGRVLHQGYDETWRWRFDGGAGAPEAERTWWSGLIAGATYRAAIPLGASNADAAPLAQLHAALGPPSTGRRAPRSPGAVLPWWLFTLILVSLLSELASRRLRGAP